MYRLDVFLVLIVDAVKILHSYFGTIKERDCNALSTSYRTIRLDATLGENDTECRDSKLIDEVKNKRKKDVPLCVV